MERIGLQAVLEDADFQAGVKNYNAGIDSMEDANKSAVASASSVSAAISAAGESVAAGASKFKSFIATKPGEVFNKAKEGVKNFADALKDAAPSLETVEKSYDQLKESIGQAIELAELGNQANRTEERFRAFAGQVGDADELLAAFQKGAGGTVDEMTAMSSAARLLQMGLVSNNDEMEQVVEIATRLGDQTQSAGDRVADFALLLANQSIPRLDNFGISSGKVRARIEELQKAFPGMSREAAFSQAVFEEGSKSLDVLGERTLDAGAKMEQARANIQNMRVEMGQRLLPIVAQVFGLIENLNTGTLALIATLSTGAGVLVKFSGGLGGAVGNLDKFATKMGTSTVALGALAAATVILVEAVGNLQETMDKMGAAQDNAQEAAASLGDQVQALVADGMSLEDAMEQVGDKVNNATANFNDARVLGVIPLKNAFNAGSEFTKTMEEATYSLQGALVANTGSYVEYTAQVAAYNEGITDSAGRLEVYTEKQYAMMQAHQEGRGFLTALSEDAGKMADVLVDLTGKAIEETDATEAIARGHSEATRDIRDATLAMEGLTAADVASSEARQGAVETSEAIAQAAANRASVAERAARVEEMQAASAAAAAAALEAKRQQDNATAVAEADLATKVMDASDAMIAQSFISGLDPEQMGLIAYRDAVENIQLAFGLATPESIALSRGMTQGIDAANEGKLAYKDLDEFILALRKDAVDGSVDFENLAHKFASSSQESEWLAENIEKTGDALTDNVAKAEELIRAEDGLETSTREYKDQMMDVSGVLANVADDTEVWTDGITGSEHALDDAQVTTDEWAQKMQGLDDKLVMTGEDLLAVDDKVQALNAGLERTNTAGADASSGLEEVQTSAGETAAALEEATTKTNELDNAMSETAGAAPGYGAAIGSGLRAGMEPEMDGFVATFRAKLQSLRDQLPSSEPKDSTSPLYGLGKSGEAIIGNLMQGVEAEGYRAVNTFTDVGLKMGAALIEAVGEGAEGLFDVAGVLGGLGGTAAGLFQQQVLDPLEAELEARRASLEALQGEREAELAKGIGLRERLDALGFQRVMAQYQRDSTKLTGEELYLAQEWLRSNARRSALLDETRQTQSEIAALTQETADQQERLLRYQEQQENLRFLQQQADLLALISEKGLDAEEILGGLRLGLDADVGAVMDAMATAMEQIIAQAEEELGIASPSKVFERIGAETMAGMALGIEKLMSMPVAQSAIATQAMIATPAAIVSPRNTTIDNSRTVGDINISAPGGTTAGNAQLVSLVRQVVREEVRGT